MTKKISSYLAEWIKQKIFLAWYSFRERRMCYSIDGVDEMHMQLIH